MPVLKHLKLLIVDNCPDTCELLTFVLEAEGAEVVAVASASQALAALDRSRFDVLISDIVMPCMDGYAFITEVRTRRVGKGGSIPAIALTALTGEVSYQRALLVGFQVCLFKPLDLDTLVNCVAKLTVECRT